MGSEEPAYIYRAVMRICRHSLCRKRVHTLMITKRDCCSQDPFDGLSVLTVATMMLVCVFSDCPPLQLIMKKGPSSPIPFPICFIIYLSVPRKQEGGCFKVSKFMEQCVLCSEVGACRTQRVRILDQTLVPVD